MEPLPGYRLLELLGRGGFGEVWKCEAPGGLHKAIKFVSGCLHALGSDAPAEEELRSIDRIKGVRHPFLLSMERVERVGDDLIIVLELADQSLADLFQQHQRAGHLGIQREPLLSYLREAAEVLDVMHVRFGLQHLDIKPENLFLVSDHIKVGDFGLVNSLAAVEALERTGSENQITLGAITPLYASPEVFKGSLSRHSDQYSLAIVYQYLVSGTMPFSGKNARQLMLQHLQSEPDGSALPQADRLVVARALSKEPTARYPSCSDLIHALISGQSEVIRASISPDSPPKTNSSQAAPTTAINRSIVDLPTDTAPKPQPHPATSTPERPSREVRTVGTVRAKRPPFVNNEKNARGWHVGELIHCTPLSELWWGQAPDGTARHLKVLYGYVGEPQAIERLIALHHPSLPSFELVVCNPGQIVLATPPPERTLRDVLSEYQNAGHLGIPRALLLRHLRTAAETLHYLQNKEGLQHLALTPRHILLTGKPNAERVLLADFGVVQLFWIPTGQPASLYNSRYASPELRKGVVSSCADQYSLALIYHELLTGTLPPEEAFSSFSSFSSTWTQDSLLSEADHSILAKALHRNPAYRWSNCLDFLRALEDASEEADQLQETQILQDQVDLAAPLPRGTASSTYSSIEKLGTDRWEVDTPQILRTRFTTSLALDVAQQRLENFEAQWNGKRLAADAQTLIFQMQSPQSFWQRWTGRQPGLEVRVRLETSTLSAASLKLGVTRTDVRVDIAPFPFGRDASADLVQVVGPLLVESVRSQLQINPHGRMEVRLPWPYTLQVAFVPEDQSKHFEEPEKASPFKQESQAEAFSRNPTPVDSLIECQGKDISLNGIGFYFPGELVSTLLRIQLPQTPQTPELSVLARIVRTQKCGDGWTEVGAVLLKHEDPSVFGPANAPTNASGGSSGSTH